MIVIKVGTESHPANKEDIDYVVDKLSRLQICSNLVWNHAVDIHYFHDGKYVFILPEATDEDVDTFEKAIISLGEFKEDSFAVINRHIDVVDTEYI